MDIQKPFSRQSQNQDYPAPEIMSRGTEQHARGQSSNGGSPCPRSPSEWRPPKEPSKKDWEQRVWGGTKSNVRSAEDDWFESRMAQNGQPKPSKPPPPRKAGWNQWVAPSLQSTKGNPDARATSFGETLRFYASWESSHVDE